MGDAEGVFLGEFLIVEAFLKLQPIFFLKQVMVVSPGFIELLHLALNALLNLPLLLIQLPLQQFRAVFHQLVTVHQVELACMGYLDYSQAPLYLPLVIGSQSKLLRQDLAWPPVLGLSPPT